MNYSNNLSKDLGCSNKEVVNQLYFTNNTNSNQHFHALTGMVNLTLTNLLFHMNKVHLFVNLTLTILELEKKYWKILKPITLVPI